MAARRRRQTRVAGYALLCLAGTAAIIWPAPTVRAAAAPTGGVLVYVWAGLLAAAACACALGAATDRWLGEYVGLPGVAATFGVYGLAALASGRLVAVAGGLAFVAIAVLFLPRWQDVAAVRRAADRAATTATQTDATQTAATQTDAQTDAQTGPATPEG